MLVILILFTLFTYFIFGAVFWLFYLNLSLIFLVLIYNYKNYFNFLIDNYKLFFSIICFGIIYFLIYQINVEFDFSRDKKYSINKNLEKISKSLTNKIEIVILKAINDSNNANLFYNKIKEIKNDILDVKLISAVDNLKLINDLKLKKENKIIVSNSLNEKIVLNSYDQKEVYNAILKLQHLALYQGCVVQNSEFLINNAEASGFTEFKNILFNQGISLKSLPIQEINNSCEIVIVPPLKGISSEEVLLYQTLKEKIKNWLFFTDPNLGYSKELENIFDFKSEQSVVVNRDNNEVSWQIILGKMSEHKISKNINEDNPVVVLIANPVKFIDGQDLFYSSVHSWAETNLELLFSSTPTAQLDGNESRGSQSIISTKESANNKHVIIGDLEIARNANIRLSGNSILFSNVANYFIGDNFEYVETPGAQYISMKSYFRLKLFFIVNLELIMLLSIWLCKKRF